MTGLSSTAPAISGYDETFGWGHRPRATLSGNAKWGAPAEVAFEEGTEVQHLSLIHISEPTRPEPI
eukprot:3083916-Pyramimonas_sp.AAC.1